MRRDYVVTYDVADDGRRARVLSVMKGHGEHLQYSVFRCFLSESEKIRMMGQLLDVLHQWEDQVLIIDLGERSRQLRRDFEVLGRPMDPPRTGPHIF